jgi:hypothetical protein
MKWQEVIHEKNAYQRMQRQKIAMIKQWIYRRYLGENKKK